LFITSGQTQKGMEMKMREFQGAYQRKYFLSTGKSDSVSQTHKILLKIKFDHCLPYVFLNEWSLETEIIKYLHHSNTTENV
jgi:hypothetical protein